MWKGHKEFYLQTSVVPLSSLLMVQGVRKAIILMRNMLLVPRQKTVAGKLIGMLFKVEIYHCVFISTGHDDT